MSENCGCLILVPTPIGNPGDFSPRAREVLAEADYIAAEDTRVTARLLAAFHLPEKNLISYHKYNEKSRENHLLSLLREGCTIAMVSDAGMPAVSDPGEILVKAALAAGIRVSSLPGPNAGLTALAASGMSTRRFCFEGFLPGSGAERKERIRFLADFPDTAILYEAPHRLSKTLRELHKAGLGSRRLCLARELSKKYETYLYLTVAEAGELLEREPPRGEYVLVLEGKQEYLLREPEARNALAEDERGRVRDGIRSALAAGLSAKEIRQKLRDSTSLGRNELYELIESEKCKEKP